MFPVNVASTAEALDQSQPVPVKSAIARGPSRTTIFCVFANGAVYVNKPASQVLLELMTGHLSISLRLSRLSTPTLKGSFKRRLDQ